MSRQYNKVEKARRRLRRIKRERATLNEKLAAGKKKKA
jgi:hypothetical protein